MPNATRPARQHRHGQQWIISQLKYVFQYSLAQLTSYVSWRQGSEDWWHHGTIGDVVYFRLEGDAEKYALAFPRALIDACGAGDYHQRQRATYLIVERLCEMGLLGVCSGCV
jgi:hypothetical protein